LTRGLWSLFSTYGAWTFDFGNTKQRPIGVIHAGGVYTLHRQDKSVVDDLYWFSEDYANDQELFEPKSGWQKIEKLRRRAMKQIRNRAYGADLERIIVRYVNALDHPNLRVSFLQLWSILEKITDTVGANYDEMIARATWGWGERPILKDMLNSLRRRRNQYVHAAAISEDQQTATYLMKGFVDPHLIRLLENQLSVSSFEEYGRSLSLPCEIKELTYRDRMLRNAIKFLNKQGERE
jgi:hypothetical protein